MICHKTKSIFIHIPRTGGSSLEKNLIGKDMWSKAPYEKHLSASACKELYSEYWDKYVKFSFVRNPWDKIISLYHLNHYAKCNALYGKSLEYFLENQVVPDWELQDQQCSAYLNEKIDFIGRFERYDEDCKALFSILGVEYTGEHLQKTKHEHYSKYYNENTKNIVAEMFSEDIKRFNYEFISK